METNVGDSQDDEHQNVIYLLPLLAILVLSSTVHVMKIEMYFIVLCAGCMFGALKACIPFAMSDMQKPWKPYVLSYLYCPILVARLTYGLNGRAFYKSLLQICIFVSCTTMTAVGLGFVMLTLNGSTINMWNVMIIGMLFKPCDLPLLYRELEGVRNLEIIMVGDAIFSTAMSLYVFELCPVITMGWLMVCEKCTMAIISTLLGLIFGFSGSYILRHLYNDPLNAVCAVVITSYITYAMSAMFLSTNGVLSSFIALLFMSQERSRIPREVNEKISLLIDVVLRVIQAIMVLAITSHLTLCATKYYRSYDIIIAFGVYVVAKLVDVIGLVLMAPLLARFGYGLKFMRTIMSFWATRKGPLVLILAANLEYHNHMVDVGQSFYLHILVFVFLSYVINENVARYIIHNFSTIKLSALKQNNVNIGFKYVVERQVAMLSILRMSRYFSDVNWNLINESTKICSPYQKEEPSMENGSYINHRRMRCPNCQKIINVEPTTKELTLMASETRIRVLKAVMVYCSRQYEVGFLSRDELRTIFQAFDIALDSDEVILKFDNLFKVFKKKRFKRLSAMLPVKHIKSTEKEPKCGISKKCFIISHSTCFQAFFYLLTIIQLGMALEHLLSKHINPMILYVGVLMLFLAFTAEFVIKLLSHSSRGVPKGFYLYITKYANLMDFTCLLFNCADVIVSTVDQFTAVPLNVKRIVQFSRAIRLWKLLKFVSYCYLSLVNYIDNKMENQIMHVLSIAQALITSYEEVVDQLDDITDNEDIRNTIKDQLIHDRLVILEELCVIHKERPWLKVTLDTKHASACTLYIMRKRVIDLHRQGVLDVCEYGKLRRMINDRDKIIMSYSTKELVRPKNIYMEVPWISYDKDIMEFLYENITTKIWKPGDIICDTGQMTEGVYIIITGVFKIIYQPRESSIKKLSLGGELPVTDLLYNTRFCEDQTDYLLEGNTAGELAVLTRRPSSSRIISHTSSQAFVIPSQILWRAIESYPDPINGLSTRLWRHVTRHIVKNILLQTPSFKLKSYQNIHSVLNRVMVPDLESYITLSLCNLVEEVVLVEGAIRDYNTEETYTAPCYIPRAVQKIRFPIRDRIGLVYPIIPRLAIVPIENADAYEVLEKIDGKSELVGSRKVSSQSKIQLRRRRISNIYNNTYRPNRLPHYNFSLNKATVAMASQNTIAGVQNQTWFF